MPRRGKIRPVKRGTDNTADGRGKRRVEADDCHDEKADAADQHNLQKTGVGVFLSQLPYLQQTDRAGHGEYQESGDQDKQVVCDKICQIGIARKSGSFILLESSPIGRFREAFGDREVSAVSLMNQKLILFHGLGSIG